MKDGFDFNCYRVERAGSPAWALSLMKGFGTKAEWYGRTWSPGAKLLAAGDASALVESFRDEVRYLAGDARRKGGLVVGVAGKWRKFGRAA